MSLGEESQESAGWVKHSRTRYNALVGTHLGEIERTGVRWTITLTSLKTGVVSTLDTRSPLSVAVQMAEKAARAAAEKEK